MTDAENARQSRRARLLAMWRDGMTYRDVGREEGISATRVGVLVKDGLRDIARAERDERRRIETMQIQVETERRAALHALSSPLRAELLTRRALAVWSAHDQERT